MSAARLALLMEMEDDWVFYTPELAARSGLAQADCRRYLREFRADGLARLTPVYGEDDGRILGSGYSLTKKGLDARIVAKNGGRSASGILTEGGDAKQAPSDSLSSPARKGTPK